MLKHEEIEAAIVLMAAKQGYALNSADMLEVRSRVASSLAAKERHRQRMTAPEFHWKKSKPYR
ncbi:hypothetical protein ACWJN6_27835 [Klebsiella pneumoniae]|nr:MULTISPECIES: hypothetical protein [Klebsiella]MDZ1509832.1 hypothetical protein [Klebsiella pneumoniae]WVH76028.1 hypothetical protein VST99_09725 [Klebsiella pneumoniae]HCT6691733.1 hypothetical protein [Klebsiella quasipneumoniae]